MTHGAAAAAALIALAGCAGPLDVGPPDGAVRVRADTWPSDRFGEWPLTIEAGWIACTDLGWVWFYDDDGRRYALNGYTRGAVENGVPGFDPYEGPLPPGPDIWKREKEEWGTYTTWPGSFIPCARTLCAPPYDTPPEPDCPIREEEQPR